MQDVWRYGTNWDEPVPQVILNEWLEFTRQWELMDRITFRRKLWLPGYSDLQIHGFCDASTAGYGACLYARSKKDQNPALTCLLCAKSRVAPLKSATIPCLELCGALLLARLYHEVFNSLNLVPDRVILWCDSTIVIHWLKTDTRRLKTFVANRVTEIRDLTDTAEWRHIRSQDNPSDAISRGQLPFAFQQNQLWRTGPSWLIENESEWPSEAVRSCEVPELKRDT